jgi:hypothetical protein
MNNSEYISHLLSLQEIMVSFPLTIKEISDNETGNQVLIWATASPVWKAEVVDGDSSEWVVVGEYFFLLSFERGFGEDGVRRVERGVEFADSLVAEKLFALVLRARGNLALLTADKG